MNLSYGSRTPKGSMGHCGNRWSKVCAEGSLTDSFHSLGPGATELRPLTWLSNRMSCRDPNRRENPIPFRLDWNNQLDQTSFTLRVADLGIRENSRGYSVN